MCWYVVVEVLYVVLKALYVLHSTRKRFHNTSWIDSWDDIHGRHLLLRVQSLAVGQRHGSSMPRCKTVNGGHERIQPRASSPLKLLRTVHSLNRTTIQPWKQCFIRQQVKSQVAARLVVPWMTQPCSSLAGPGGLLVFGKMGSAVQNQSLLANPLKLWVKGMPCTMIWMLGV